MNCPACGLANRDAADLCTGCGLDLASQEPTGIRPPDPPPVSIGEWARRSQESQILPGGFRISGRYQIVRFLGRGGMGSVYVAHDYELDREVALKFLHHDLHDPEVALARFKREIALSSVITHPNVLRVYDLAEVDGVKFLSMQYVDGDDLERMIRSERKLPVDRALQLFRQICQGMTAAHEEGVVHRDIKPQNVLIDRKTGHAYVTDFGLATSDDQESLTASGAVLGTPYYMAPEQVRGEEADSRSDIYALGVLLFEMLTGAVPFHGGTQYEMMARRLSHPPPDVRTLEPAIPAETAAVIDRCLAIDPHDRFQSVSDILAAIAPAAAAPQKFPLRRPAIAAAAAIAVLAVITLLLFLRPWSAAPPAAPQPQKILSVLVADVDNRTGDEIFDRSLEPVLTLSLEGAPFLAVASHGQAHKTAEGIDPAAETLDERIARLVAIRDGVSVVITSAIRAGKNGFLLTGRAEEAATGRVLGEVEARAKKRDDVLSAAESLAIQLRRTLGDRSAEVAMERGETFTAASLQAAKAYAVGQELQWAGKYEEAIRAYQQAATFDPSMGRAYSGIAAMHANLGNREQAETNYRLALSHLDRMSEREKYRTRGGYYLFTRNDAKAVEEFSALLRHYPADTAGGTNLAYAHFNLREMRRAVEEGRKPVDIMPKNVLYRNNLALYAMYAGDFDTALKEAHEVLEANPSFMKAYLAVAVAAAGQEKLENAKAAYAKMAGISKRGASLSAVGAADLALYRGDAAGAIAILEKAVAVDLEADNSNAAARKQTMLAEAELLAGNRRRALATAHAATETSDSDAILYSAARVLIAAGDYSAAAELADRLRRKIQAEPQMYASLLDGESLLVQEKPREALERVKAAQGLADSWMGRFLLARAYCHLGAFAEAHSELEVAIQRRGEATALLLDDVPTVRLLPLLDYELGCISEGLRSPAAKAAFERFLRARSEAKDDPLVIDAKRRLGLA